MKLKCLHPGLFGLTPGNEYEIAKCRWPGYYLIGDPQYGNNHAITDFETPLLKFTRLIAAAEKVVIPSFDRAFRVYFEMTSSYLIFYSHKPGNYYNLSGRHYRYYHDGVTGNFIAEEYTKREEVIFQQRILKADLLQLQAIRRNKANNSIPYIPEDNNKNQ